MSLVVCENLNVETQQGNSLIELCIGSVTKADTKDPVDVLVISAYPGDYTATRTSVIGALKYDLNVNVRQLAANKERDYRRLFSCWWSKVLPNGLPFERIMCFEGSFKRNSRPPSTVSEVFRCLVSLCEDKEISVMMPLLSTGDQFYSKDMMLRLIIETSIHWMKIGLPLKKLRIVLYQNNPETISRENNQLINYFSSLKDEWLQMESSRNLETSHFVYDYYITNATKDDAVTNLIKTSLQTLYKDCKIYHEKQSFDSEKSWQDHIYDVMVTCSRVLIILSPDFLEDSSCIEKYNIAMCCSRNMSRNYLAPIYVNELKELPTYMGLIQYIDIRPVSDDSINEACKGLPTFKKKDEITLDLNTALNHKPVSLDSAFDVFISYSHKNHDVANVLYDHIKKSKPHWIVFLDQDSLKAGHAWQSKLYNSIENSKTVLVLLSKTYLESKVCQEEYNLAKCLSDDAEHQTKMVEVMLDEIKEFPRWCTPHLCIKMNEVKEKKLEKVVEYLDQDREFSDYSRRIQNTVLSIDSITSIWRQQFAKENFTIIPSTSFIDQERLKGFDLKETNEDFYHILIICHLEQTYLANLLKSELLNYLPQLRCLIVHNEQQDALAHHIFDKCKILVPLLSKEYYEVPILMEHFNTALCRHRFENEIVIFPIITGKLPLKPVYPRITFCLFSTEDKMWKNKDKNNSSRMCLNAAAIVIANIIITSPENKSSFKTLLSVRELEQWAFCEERLENRTELSPLCFGNVSSGHVVVFEDKKPLSDQSTVVTSETSGSLLITKGSHSVQLSDKSPNNRNKTVESISIPSNSGEIQRNDTLEPNEVNSNKSPGDSKKSSEPSEIDSSNQIPSKGNETLEPIKMDSSNQTTSNGNETLEPGEIPSSSTNKSESFEPNEISSAELTRNISETLESKQDPSENSASNENETNESKSVKLTKRSSMSKSCQIN